MPRMIPNTSLSSYSKSPKSFAFPSDCRQDNCYKPFSLHLGTFKISVKSFLAKRKKRKFNETALVYVPTPAAIPCQPHVLKIITIDLEELKALKLIYEALHDPSILDATRQVRHGLSPPVTKSPISTVTVPSTPRCSRAFIIKLVTLALEASRSATLSTPITRVLDAPRIMGTLDLRVLRFLGEGTSGTVYLVKDRISRAKLALKVIPKRGRNEYSLNIVVKERNLAAKLADCPWFVNMWAAWHDQAHFYIAMTLYPTDLDSEMIRCNVIEPLRARFYMAEMIIALTELHSRGIIHRDIKAPNILIDREGHIVLADFGLSKDFHKIPTIAERVFQPYWPYLPGDKPTSETEPRDPEELHFVAWNYRGSEMEMAPEIHLRRPYSFGVDFWSIAIILFWMSTGRPPFWDEEEDYEDEGEDDVKPLMYKIAEDPLHWEETDDVDDVTMDFLEKMLAKDPRKRLTISFEMPAHPYFAGLNWSLMETRMVPPPWVPGNRINHVYEPTSATFTPGLPYSDAIEDPFPNFTFNSAQVQNRLLHPDEDESDSDDDSDANTMHGDVGDDLEDQFADVPLNRSADDERNTDSLENQDDQDARTLSANSNAVHELDVKASWDRSIINPPATRPYGPGPKSWIHGPDLLNLRSSLPTTPSAPLTLNISPHPLFRANPQASSTQRLDFKTRPCVASDDPTISSSRPQTTTHVVNGVGVMFKLKVWVWKIWNPKPKKGPQMKRLSLSS